MSDKGKKISNSQPGRKYPRVSIVFTKPSLTKQSFLKDSDINNVMAKYQATGQLPELIKENPKFGDFSEMLEYQESMNLVALANEQFAALPAKVRKRFGNDPAEFLAFAEDPKNGREMVSLGLATERPQEPKEAPKNDPKPSPKGDPQGQPPGGP